MTIQTEIRALAFLKLEEILENEYKNISDSNDQDTDDIIIKLENILQLLKSEETDPIRFKKNIANLLPEHLI